MDVLLCGNAVGYAVAGQDASGLSEQVARAALPGLLAEYERLWHW